MGTRTVIVGTCCVLLLLSGCAHGTSGPPEPPGGSMSTEPAGSPSPEPSHLSLPPGSPTSSAKEPGNLTLSGQVEPGVEAGCLIMKTGGKTYLLLGGDPAVVRAGAQVRVTGRLVTNIRTYCMQGTPFQVSEAHPA